ncbi:RepB family plasmid replication initiator protein (plasmid) [Campylobacter coli]
MSEIVKYHNDFNKIQLPSFTEQEQNLLFLIFARIKEKGIDNEAAHEKRESVSR